MKAKSKKILGIASFATSMVALAYLLYYLYIAAVTFAIVGTAGFVIAYAIGAGVAFAVFIGIWLSVKPKRKMF
jgi:hypothetical protein